MVLVPQLLVEALTVAGFDVGTGVEVPHCDCEAEAESLGDNDSETVTQ